MEEAAPASVEAFGYKQELKRSLSLWDLLVYGLVFIAPGAPVAVFGIVFNASHGMVPLVYLVGLVAMVFTALSYMTMSRLYPVAGSVYSYAARSIGDWAGFIAGWALLLDYVLLPTLGFLVCAIWASRRRRAPTSPCLCCSSLSSRLCAWWRAWRSPAA